MVIYIFTTRKQSLRRLHFYTCLSVILFMGGRGSTWGSTPWAITPPGRYTPRQLHPLAGTPAGQVAPAGNPPSRYTPRQVHPQQVTPPWQVHPQAGTPPGRFTPLGMYTPWTGTPPSPHAGTPPTGQIHPPRQCMLGYGQQAGGTHPTGMHSC